MEAMENVRRSFQEALYKAQRKYLQAPEEAAACPSRPSYRGGSRRREYHAPFSYQFLQAYALKEAFYDFMAASNCVEAERRLDF